MESKMSRLQLEDTVEDGQECSDIEADYQCEYREDIWKNLLEQEAEKPQIHLTSPQLEFRGVLVKQLRAVRRRLRLSCATLHAAVQLLDMFMDRHELRTDRLSHSALACLSLAAKSEEKLSRAPRLSTLSSVSGVALSAATFRQLEWMVGQHVRWRLLMPTAATFASLMAHHVVSEDDLVSRSEKFARRFRADGLKQLESYLDLTLSDVRLKVMGAAEVGCACVACARAALGLPAWPSRLAAAAGHTAAQLAPVARLLQGMMRVLKSRDDPDADHGYGSAHASPDPTPAASPRVHSPGSSAGGAERAQAETCVVRRDQLPRQRDYKAELQVRDAAAGGDVAAECPLHRYRTPGSAVMQSALDSDYRFVRSQRLIEASLDRLDAKGVKRAACRDVNTLQLESKRYRVDLPSQRLL